MPEATAAGALDVAEPLLRERAEFTSVLAALTAADWDLPTECPAWTVKGIALHVLGDDLSLLSRQRDTAQPSVFRNDVGEWAGKYDSLDDFNEQWVETASFLSPQLIVTMLQSTGTWTLDWYTTVDPDSRGEAVAFYSPQPAPYWMIAAREYLERWIHQSQIRRAARLPPLDDDAFLVPAAATVARAFPNAFGPLPAADGTAVSVAIDDVVGWNVRRNQGTWHLYDGVDTDSAIGLSLSREAATLLFSRGYTPAEVEAAFAMTGDVETGRLLAAGFGSALGRTDP